MAPDNEEGEDLYDDEFDFVDEDDDAESDLDDGAFDEDESESELDAEPAPRDVVAKRPARDAQDDVMDDRDREEAATGVEEPVDGCSRPEVPANYRVHVYEYRQFKRTIDRPFTAEDAEAFASEYNRTSKSYGRFALAGKEDVKPKKSLD